MNEPDAIPAPPAAEKPVLKLRKPGSASPEPVVVPPPMPPKKTAAQPAPQAFSPPAANRQAPYKPSLGFAGWVKPLAFVLFAIVGGAMGALKYGGFVDYPVELVLYGPWLVLAFHAVVVLLAFQEDLFAGVLCILVPGYSLYYLVFRTGRPFFVALVLGLLVGLGEDAFYAFKSISINAYDNVNGLLAGSRGK